MALLVKSLLAVAIIGTTIGVHGQESGCKCIPKLDQCGCCVHLDIPSIDINDKGCVNLAYLPKDYGISVTLVIDGHVIINETISARHPPPLCAAVPYLKNAASICLDFYDLDVSNSTFSGCVDLQAKLYYVLTEKIHIGCWRIGSAYSLVSQPEPHAGFLATQWNKTLTVINKASEKRKSELKMIEKMMLHRP